MSTNSPHRRWFQFSLRTLLIGITLIGAGAGLLMMKIEKARRQEAALVSMEKHLALVTFADEYDKDGNYSGGYGSGEGFSHQDMNGRTLADIRSLSYSLWDVDDEQLRLQLAELPGLTSLTACSGYSFLKVN